MLEIAIPPRLHIRCPYCRHRNLFHRSPWETVRIALHKVRLVCFKCKKMVRLKADDVDTNYLCQVLALTLIAWETRARKKPKSEYDDQCKKHVTTINRLKREMRQVPKKKQERIEKKIDQYIRDIQWIRNQQQLAREREVMIKKLKAICPPREKIHVLAPYQERKNEVCAP